ncbi:CCE_0567 family metalloprotein [Stutzerimonas kirkiae]|uniref:Rop-like protein n=1 Tax=Stutzerimonas kirkiae TaxID=2211392 RepID=A0A4Q9RCC7_9GAMM|nr:CCE_0567 family metalloprotein [Stutzerimonas kirkiae]TBU98829.1 hypothetical protein DNJ96_03705 [Stutzerimonas kirkiae]TBV03923.1 hypothetical protein DNJ95_06115 [Stutzerimonas kirkiae]TBV09665.1 hypothetical protein DNK08_08525 [Stutzerimonas kirkiae]TBV16802.1 hypothetical protein DNK01_02825 [Stutzerimonas kirkiae]
MGEEQRKALQKEVSQKKRIASEWASQVHDLVEDRLLSDYEELPELAQRTRQACRDWAEAKARLEQAGA